MDHLAPKSRGGADSWLNTVAACAECNQRKADRTPEQAGMRLLRRPFEPTPEATLMLALGLRAGELGELAAWLPGGRSSAATVPAVAAPVTASA